jgi:hypothetical protein
MLTIFESKAGHRRKTARDMVSERLDGPSMKLSDKSIAAFPVFVLVLSLVVLGSDAGRIASRLRGVLFDAYQHGQPRSYADTVSRAGFSIRVLDADAPSLARFGPWPWPRSTLAALLGELKAKGAALAVFAFPLDVPDPLSPKNLAAQTQAGPGGDAARAALDTMVSPDLALTRAMSHLATATGFVLGAGNGARVPIPTAQVSFVGAKNPLGRAPSFAGATRAIAPLERMSVGTGALNLAFDADGQLRRMPLVFQLRDRAVAALTAEVLRLIEHKSRFVVRSNDGESGLFGSTPGIASIEVLNTELPTTPDGAFWIAFTGKRVERNVSAAALDEGAVASTRLANAVVILGPPGEPIATPDGPRSVADVYAEALENALTGSALRRPVARGVAVQASRVLEDLVHDAPRGVGLVRVGVVRSARSALREERESCADEASRSEDARKTLPDRRAHAPRSSSRIGSRRMRFPVSAKIALHTAGAAAGSPGSPNPVGGATDLTKCTSTTGGECCIRNIGYSSKLVCPAAPRSMMRKASRRK